MTEITKLILTRRPGEIIFVGEDIEIQVLEVRGNKVSIRIAAPKDMTILRKEIANQIINKNNGE